MGEKEQKRRRKLEKRKAKRPQAPAEAQPLQAVSTVNGKIIRDLMLAHKVKGNHKDYVIITGSRLMDWSGSYEISKNGQAVNGPPVALIHKSKLRNLIGEDAAASFWRHGIGRVAPQTAIRKMNEASVKPAVREV